MVVETAFANSVTNGAAHMNATARPPIFMYDFNSIRNFVCSANVFVIELELLSNVSILVSILIVVVSILVKVVANVSILFLIFLTSPDARQFVRRGNCMHTTGLQIGACNTLFPNRDERANFLTEFPTILWFILLAALIMLFSHFYGII
jgi:hypothetical protein